MNQKVPMIYRDYPEVPYISKERNLADWQANPDQYPYDIVARKQMIRLKEGLLPGDIILLWRIHFGNFTTESSIPQYFEYKYGIDTDQSKQLLLDKQYIILLDAKQSLDQLTVPQLKKLLFSHHLNTNGRKRELIERLDKQVPIEQLNQQYLLRKYQITEQGKQLLDQYQTIIQAHGLKY